MGKRSGIVEHDEGLARLTLAELDGEIARCQMRLKIAPTDQLRKAFKSRLRWLEKFRAEHR
jgi:hypothetical protein